jgi:L-ornithine N5-oxygenase
MQELDVVGVGLGPGNLSLVTAMLDRRDAGLPLPGAVFLERSPTFAWHTGMMLPGSKVQVPFLKDLATHRNPRSRYTFLNFLFEHGRLEQFTNLRELFPDREEFFAYFEWIAAQAAALVRYSTTVTHLRPAASCGGRIERIEVVAESADGARRRWSARAVVLAIGRRPALPPSIRSQWSDRIVHTSELRTRFDSGLWGGDRARRFLVLGGGQSAAEAACFLLRERTGALVEMCHRRFALGALDDNPFVNQWFFGGDAERFHDLDEGSRRRVTADLSASNFGVADKSVLDELYRYHYAGLRSERTRFTLLHGHELVSAQDEGGIVRCWIRDLCSGELTERSVDGLVVATGYEDAPSDLLCELEPWLQRDHTGRYDVARTYRLASASALEAAVFLHGARQDRHGPAELNLSALALRGGVLLDALEQCLSPRSDDVAAGQA